MKSAYRKMTRFFVYITIAFLAFSPFASSVKAQNVLGEATTFNESQMNLYVAKPAVVQITQITYGQVVITTAAAAAYGAPALNGRAYDFVLGFSGSGFFVTPDGYLITNGHVANPTEDTTAYYAFAQLSETILKDVLSIFYEQYAGYPPTDTELEDLYSQHIYDTYGGDMNLLIDAFLQDYKSGTMKLDGVETENYVQMGAAFGTQTQVTDYGKVANLVDSLYEGDFNSKDLALLKVEGSNFPTVELGSFTNVSIGTEVFAIGYPGIVDSATGYFTDTQSELEPSMTQGIISAKKTLVDGTEAFQTDAAITHGNSGGPALGTDGKVIGVATWTFGDTPGGEGFNFLISVEQVESLLSRNNVTNSSSTSTAKWKEALELYSDKCYSNAKIKFEEAKTLYADNVDIEDFITRCQEGIDKGEDTCGSDTTLWIIIGGGACCFLLLVAIVVIVFVFVLGKKRNKGSETKVESKELKK